MKFIVNADYEIELFKDIVKPFSEEQIQRARLSRQYLFYFINKDPSASIVSYWDLPNTTKDYFSSFGLKLPRHVEGSENAVNWYGQLKNLNLERKLNNKLSVLDLMKSFDELPSQVSVVHDSQEIKKVLKNDFSKKWILKSPYSCGGQNIIFIKREDDIPAKLEHTYILEPYLDRVLDMSLYFDPNTEETFYYISHIHQNCTYLGGRIYQDINMLDEDLKKDGIYDLFMSVVQRLERYLEEIKTEKLSQPLTLDSFIYRDHKGELKGYPLCETNYRISMGTMNSNLRHFLPEKGVGLLMAFKANKNKDWKNILPYSNQNKTGIISLNEGNPQSAIILLSAPDLKTLKKYNELAFNFEK